MKNTINNFVFIFSMYGVPFFGTENGTFIDEIFLLAHLHMYFVCFYVKKRKKASEREINAIYKNRRLICNTTQRRMTFLFN